MAREFSKGFYNSKAWRKCRDAYKEHKYHICERCSMPGEEVHHKTYLSSSNINNPDVTLNWDNLELLCQSCHSIEHTSKYDATREDVVFDDDGNLIRNV